MGRGSKNQKDAKEGDSPGTRGPWEADKGNVRGGDTVLSAIPVPHDYTVSSLHTNRPAVNFQRC